MLADQTGIDVELISGEALAWHMTNRGVTVRDLAEQVGCSPAFIGHLRTGQRRNIKPAWAAAIEEALQTPPGSLFVARPSTVQSDTREGVA